MADTRRSQSTLASNLPDNTSGLITPQDIRDLNISAHPEKAIQTGAQASIPGSSQLTGDLYLPSDGYYLHRYSGSAWVPWGPIWPMTAPSDGSFSWVNQGTGSVVTTYGGITLTVPDAASTDYNVVARVKSAPTAPYTITAYWRASSYLNNFHHPCLIFREASSGKLVTFGPFANSFAGGTGSLMYVMYLTNPTTAGSAQFSEDLSLWGAQDLYREGWWQIADNNTNRVYSVSPNGHDWVQVYSEGRTTNFTADQVGFGMNSRNANGTARTRYMTLLSWKEE